MSVDEVAALLGVAKQTIYNWVHSESPNGIPYHKLGPKGQNGALRFSQSEVLDWSRAR